MVKSPDYGSADAGSRVFSADSSIVQCPGCKTRFAIDRSVIDDLDFPKFHCSRCDHVFGLGEGVVGSEGISAQPAPAPRVEPLVESVQSHQSMRPDPTQPTSAFKSSNPPVVGEPQIAFQFATSSAPTGKDLGLPDKPVTRVNPFPTEEDFIDRDIDYPDYSRSDYDFSFMHDERARRPSSPTSPEILRNDNLAWAKSTIMSGWSAFAVLATPLALLLALVAATSIYLRGNVNLATTLSNLIAPAAHQLAPVGLEIKQPKFKRVTLDSGDGIYLVSGKITNNTERKFKDVIVEGFAFDRSGAPLATSRAHLASTLANTRIKALTPQMIAGLQGVNEVEHFELAPGAEQEFSLALVGSDGERDLAEARYFGSRIYSVKN